MRLWFPAAMLLFAVHVVWAVSPGKVYASEDLPMYEPSISPSSLDVSAGHEYEVNIEGEEASDEWAGIFGDLDIFSVLGSGNYKIFEWEKDVGSGEVLVTYTPDVNFQSLTDTNADLLSQDLNSEIGWYAIDEPVNKTFIFDENVTDCTFSSNTVVALLYGDFSDPDSNISPEWPVCAYHESDPVTDARAVFSGKIYSGLSFDGNVADYQVLVAVPYNGSTYVYFWVS